MADLSQVKLINGTTYNLKDANAMRSSLKGAANGVAELDSNGKVPSGQLPSYVDDVLEYASLSNFPATGETGKIYVAKDTNLTYRWSGTAYVEISPSLALGETSSTAYRGDRGKDAYDHANDSSRLTTATASGLYKVASTAEGHIASLTAVVKSDITGLGIPGSDTNTHRPIQMNGSEILGNNTTALNLKAGSNVSLSNSSGTVTIAATDTTYSSKAAVSGGTDVSLVTTGEKYTWNNKAAGNHTHSLSIATDSGTNQLTMVANTKYKLTAGGSTYIFTTPPDNNSDTKVTQTNSTTSADNRLVLSATADDTTRTEAAVKSTNFRANPSTGEFYARGFRRIDITGQTVNINDYNLSAGTPNMMFYIEKTDGGANNITNIPVAGKPFLLDVEVIRWASTSDYITRQTFRNANNPANEYVRFCTNGTWGSWTTRVFTDGNNAVTQTASTGNANYEVLFSVTADNTTRTEGARKNSNLLFNPSTGNLQATQLNGVTIGSSPKFTDTWTAMTGATSNANGTAGYVPAPPAGWQTKGFLRASGEWAVPPNDDTHYKATKTSIGSAGNWSAGSVPTLGTTISADDITAWSAGSLPTLGTAIAADDITAWTANTATTPMSASASKGVLTFTAGTKGTAASLSYTARSIPNVTGVGSLPSLSYTARSIPNVTSVGSAPSLTITSVSVATGIVVDES